MLTTAKFTTPTAAPTRQEMAKAISEIKDPEGAAALIALSYFLTGAFSTESFDVPEEIGSLIPLSPEGESIFDKVRTSRPEISEAAIKMGILESLFHRSILIDLNSYSDKLLQFISFEIQANRLIIPFGLGRDLYDRFNDLWPGREIDFLDYRDSRHLLDGKPQGVYQVGRFIAGPLGILESFEKRFIPPHSRLPLWHCSDTGCRSAHYVKLVPSNCEFVVAQQEIANVCSASPPASTWPGHLIGLVSETGVIDRGKKSPNALPFLAEVLTEEERKHLLIQLITSESGPTIRRLIEQAYNREKRHHGSPSEVAGRLSDRERLQLLLILPTSTLLRMTDQLIYSGTIQQSPYEMRGLRHQVDGSDWEMSSLGIRTTSTAPKARMANLIWSAYETTGTLSNLSWILARGTSKPSKNAFLAKLGLSGPQDIIKELVLPSANITTWLAAELELGIATHSDNSLVDALLWKMGFSVPRFDDVYSQTRKRLYQFRDTLSQIGMIETEEHRERVRSSGVNLFVSVEALLADLISYNVWLLASDHFLNTQFQYLRRDANSAVPVTLGTSLEVGSQIVTWNPSGQNTLGVLLAYIDAADRWIAARKTASTSELERPDDSNPHYRFDGEMPFAFLHTQFWADADTSALNSYSTDFSDVVSKVRQADPAFVRNGLDHIRTADTFPTMEKLRTCVSKLIEAFEKADELRIFPKVYWLVSRLRDRYGRIEYTYMDYNDRLLKVAGPSSVAGLPRVSEEDPVVIAPGGLLPASGTEIRFLVKVESSYHQYWEGYPRRVSEA